MGEVRSTTVQKWGAMGGPAPVRCVSKPGEGAFAVPVSTRDFGTIGAMVPAATPGRCDKPRVPPDLARRRLPAVNILIVDDCALQRENLASILGHECALSPSVAWDLPSMRAATTETAPSIVLLSMMTRDSIALLCAVRQIWPLARVIVVGIAEDDEAGIIACAEAGVAAYHLRSESLCELRDLIAKVADGESVCSTQISAVLLRYLSTMASDRRSVPGDPDLTTREMQILRMLEQGLSNKDIADQLCITLHTVKNHVHSILSKLGVRTRAEAAVVCRSLR
ncbi:MAG: response regulator transcription factor [Mycolicibacterium rufum]|uniref:Transcriptional regulatory protein DegU n=1 Tax=Mycolicibacterium chlorophenolicum TaxID=37916 RepID=A0A0J6WLD5_9MYCO|nr:Transcriptional regulatory protein DegU [Mycolicibacterium chlorophenolicum]MBI5336584.1 response regulator transcription factor [Mycolicibacterium rufum]